MKTMILYQSKHHGNTKKLVDAICATDPEVQAIDVATVDKDHEEIDLSEYPLIGIASGIYYGKFDQTLLRIMQKSVFDGYMVFGLMTYGGKNKWYTRDLEGIARAQRATYIGTYGACGYDTFGPFKLVGGVMKGHPTAEEVQGAADWYERLIEEYGEPIQNEYVKRRKREAWEAAHPDPSMMAKLKNTARHIAGIHRKQG